jgi:hypothetical protein
VQPAVKAGAFDGFENRRAAAEMRDAERARRDAAGEAHDIRQGHDIADAQGIVALPAQAVFLVTGGDAGAPLGGVSRVRNIRDGRKQTQDALGAAAFARPHGFVHILVAEAVFFGVGDQNDGGKDEGLAGCLVGRSDGEINGFAGAGAVKRL